MFTSFLTTLLNFLTSKDTFLERYLQEFNTTDFLRFRGKDFLL